MDNINKDRDVPPCPPKLKKFLRHLSDEKRAPDIKQGFGIGVNRDQGNATVVSLTGVAAQLPAPPAQGAWVLGSVNGTFQWFPVGTC